MIRCRTMLLLAALASSGCSPERSRAITEPAADSSHDYRQMIERSRARQSSQNSLQDVQDAIQKFQAEIGRPPTNIVELVIRNYVKSIPTLPRGQFFSYDPTRGWLTITNATQTDTLSPKLPDAPDIKDRPTLAP